MSLKEKTDKLARKVMKWTFVLLAIVMAFVTIIQKKETSPEKNEPERPEWQKIHSQGKMNFVYVNSSAGNDKSAYEFIAEKVCKKEKVCTVIFWDEKENVPTEMPMTDEQVNTQVAHYVQNKHTKYKHMRLCSNGSCDDQPAADDNRSKVKDIFKSDSEKTAKDAIWTADNIFKVGVVDDGENRDGYANYVCQILYDNGFSGKKIWVQIVDIAKLSKNKKWVKLGEARCK